MLHVATVHYRSARWIEIQTRQLREHLSVDYMTWTSLEGIDPSYGSRFDRVLRQHGRHAGKLNHLALEISHEADEDDLIMFLDGDAFPIADPMPVVAQGLERAPLVAIRRLENLREPQPHPSFCVTSVRTWRSLPGDWSLGCTWRTPTGRTITDVGGNLRRALELSETPWVPLLRSNGQAVHPVFFGIYADVIYHHGAGFRDSYVTRTDRERLVREVARRSATQQLLARARNRLLGRAWNQDANERIRDTSEQIFAAIERGEIEWLKTMQGPAMSLAEELDGAGERRPLTLGE